MSSTYDDVPYTDHAYAEAHPDRLAVVARLSGWTPPAVSGARVLEIGCGRGGNLLPMAVELPNATLVGIDASARQIDEAREIAAACGLGNVSFHASRFEDSPLAAEKDAFDFIVCHGVASWISPDARRHLFERIARWLAPDGVAYVSVNVLPGWYARLPARDWLRFASSKVGLALADDEARASLAWLGANVSPEEAPYRAALDAVRARLDATDRAYLVHEYLADEHHALYVAELIAETDRAGLTYLGDAIPAEVAVELLPDEAHERAARLDVHAAQTLVDFVRNTAFRRALFVRADTARARGWRWPARLDSGALDALHVRHRVPVTGGEESARGGDRLEGPLGSVHIFDPVVGEALAALARASPRSLRFRDLAAPLTPDSRRALADELLLLSFATGALALHAYDPPLATTAHAPGSTVRPRASALARWRLAHGGPLTNAWHEQVELAEDATRIVLGLCDGARTKDEIARAVAPHWPALRDAEVCALVDASVDLLSRSALFVG